MVIIYNYTLIIFIHIGRGLYYGSYYYNSNSWFSGIIIFIILMAIAFIGYAVYFIPVFLGAPEVVYPRINNIFLLKCDE